MANLKSIIYLVLLLSVCCLYYFIYKASDNEDVDAYGQGPLPKLSVDLPALSRRSLDRPDNVDMDKTVFITGVDKSHFNESKDSIASIQRHLPGHRIIYYDLGLTGNQANEVKTWCNVNHVKFDFQKYPPFVKNLQSYAFKSLIIQEVLQNHNYIVWFDASVRVKCSNLMRHLTNTTRRTGIALVDETGHSSFAVTHKEMYKFISGNSSLLKQARQYGASFIALINTRTMLKEIIMPWAQCSLNADCIAPKGAKTSCYFKKNSYTEYAGCHRFDQSALNLLLLNLFGSDANAYVCKNACVIIERSPTSYFKLQMCKV